MVPETGGGSAPGQDRTNLQRGRGWVGGACPPMGDGTVVSELRREEGVESRPQLSPVHPLRSAPPPIHGGDCGAGTGAGLWEGLPPDKRDPAADS